MKRFLLYLSLSIFSLLGLFILSAGMHLVGLIVMVYPVLGWATGAFLAVLFGAVVVYPLALVISALIRSRRSWVAGSWAHNRYQAHLARQHRRHPVLDQTQLFTSNPYFLDELYLQLFELSNKLILDAAEKVFFHTAISQSGRFDTFVLLSEQSALINRIADLYHPHSRLKILPSLYADILEAAMRPSHKDELNLGSQIGPAVVGASIVGAIPGANLVSILISDAIVQGSANALATLRMGLLARRFFHRALEGGSVDLETERLAVNQEAADMLSPLVEDASGTLSRIIWNTAKYHLGRVPAVAFEGLKSAVSRSVRGLVRGKAKEKAQAEISSEQTTAPS